jgi:enoyl-CoA hydratase
MGLIFEKEEHIAHVRLNRPEAKNALDPETLIELLDAWDEIQNDPGIRVAVLSSALPDIFCAGMDLKSTMPMLMRTNEPETEAEKRVAENPGLMLDAMLRNLELDKPIVSAVHGYCLTGGWEMVMATDIRIASEDARFQMREVQYAMMPTSGATVRLPRMIPYGAAMEILLAGDPVPAQRLLEWGFLNRVVPEEKLMETAMGYAERIASNGPLAVKAIKQSVRECLGLPLREALQKELEIGMPIFLTEDAREGPRAFREKRKPLYKGR